MPKFISEQERWRWVGWRFIVCFGIFPSPCTHTSPSLGREWGVKIGIDPALRPEGGLGDRKAGARPCAPPASEPARGFPECSDGSQAPGRPSRPGEERTLGRSIPSHPTPHPPPPRHTPRDGHWEGFNARTASSLPEVPPPPASPRGRQAGEGGKRGKEKPLRPEREEKRGK